MGVCGLNNVHQQGWALLSRIACRGGRSASKTVKKDLGAWKVLGVYTMPLRLDS